MQKQYVPIETREKDKVKAVKAEMITLRCLWRQPKSKVTSALCNSNDNCQMRNVPKIL